jgi:uridine phosphorylase
VRYIQPEVIMRARANGAALPVWTAAVIVFHSQTRSKPIVERLGGQPLSHRVFSGLEPYEVLSTTCRQQGVGILCNVGGKMGGGPLTSALVEELASIGVRWLVGLGCAGSIHPSVPRGVQFVVSSALATDGTSRAYLSDNATQATPDKRMLHLLDSVRSRFGYSLSTVTAGTVDALYRETPPAVAGWRASGAHVINMEAAPFYAAAAACEVPALYIGHVSDELFGAEWKDWFGDDRTAMAVKSAEIAARVLEEALNRTAP